MKLYVMFISKRQNSTLQPTGGTEHDVFLKQDTSIINPTFIIDSNNLNLNVNYCRCTDTGRYYFIRDIICRNDHIYELVCEIDTLASFKDQILASSAFIMYAASGSANIPDDRMTTTKNFTITHADAAFPSAVGGNNYFISVTGNNGVETFYVMRTDIATMFDALNFDTITVTQGSTTEETLKNVGDAIGLCFEQSFTQGTVMNNIRSAYVLPFPPDEECLGTPKNIHCGFYDTNVEGEPLVEAVFSQAIALAIPWSVADWRRLSPYSVVAVYLPYFGVISLDSNSLISSSYVTVKYSICYYNGDLSYSIETEQNRIIATGKCNVAAPWGIGSSAGGGSVINNAIGAAAADISQIGGMLGKIPLIGKYIEGSTNTAAGVTQSFVKPASTEGGLGGFSDSGLDLRLHCWVMTKEFSDTQANFASLCGYPVMRVGTLAGRTGYLQTNGFEMAGSATSQERNIINALLDSGIFIE